MRRPATRSYGSKAPSRASQRAALTLMLCNCPVERLRTMTAQDCVASFGGTIAEAQRELDSARRARGVA